MESLFNPNVAYLLLVGGMVLLIAAIFSPGTGFMELGALMSIILGGLVLINLPDQANWWAVALLVVGVVPFLLAVRRSRKLIYLMVAIAAFIIGSAFLFQGDDWWKPGIDPLLAVIVSLAAGGYVWIATTKVLEADRVVPRHDLSLLVGADGEAKTQIDDEGTVQVMGELWSARSQEPIPEGAQIKVVGRDGFILDVTRAEKP